MTARGARIRAGLAGLSSVAGIALMSLLLAACSSGGQAQAGPTPTLSETQQEGKRLFTQFCISCHSTSPDIVIVGPSLAGVGSRAASRVDGQDAHEYLETSLTQPDAYLVEGFNDLMPKTFKDTLTDEEMEALMAYMLTLK